MSLKDKMELLAEKRVKVPAHLEARVDSLLTRYAALEKKDVTLFDPMENEIVLHEQGIEAIEEAVAAIERGSNLPTNGSGTTSGAVSTETKPE